MDCIVHGAAKSQTRLSDFRFTFLHFHGCTRRGVGFGIRGPSLVALCLRRMHGDSQNPRLSAWTGPRGSKHILIQLDVSCMFCFSALIFYHFSRLSWTKTDPTFFPGTQSNASSHKAQPLVTWIASDNNCSTSNGQNITIHWPAH